MTDTLTTAGGVQNQAPAYVSADQVSILGDGSTENPLQLADGQEADFPADFVPDLPFTASVGLPVAVIAGTPQEGSVSVVKPADAGPGGAPFVIGIVTAVDDDLPTPVVTVRGFGNVTLTTAEWDNITGGSGGLTRGAAYYLDPGSVGGLTTTVPTDPGDFLSQVGIAINPTTLGLCLPSIPLELS